MKAKVKSAHIHAYSVLLHNMEKAQAAQILPCFWLKTQDASR